MNKKMQWFTRISAVCFVGLAILAAELSLVGLQHRNLTTRQPISGVPVQRLGKRFEFQRNMQAAKKWAERLDAQASELLQVSSMGRFERWRKDIDVDGMKRHYTQDMMAHLKAMTTVFKMRRENGGFKKLREFEFQSMIRKSDYLLALPATKSSFDFVSSDQHQAQAIHELVAQYNKERLLFDQKVITVAKNK